MRMSMGVMRSPRRRKSVKLLQPGDRSAKVLAIAAQKGGVGKTTTAVSLASAWARLHKRKVLVVDLAPPASLSISQPGEVHMSLVNEWVGDILKEKGASIYRMKGVLCIAHASRRFVFHAVHMHMEGTFEAEWADDEPRESKLVFIGKNLDAEELREGFKLCMHTPELEQVRLEQLRFDVGDSVECNVGGVRRSTWKKGAVVQKRYRNEYMPPGLIAAYQVRLDDSGDLIYAPEDVDEIIRKI